ncbi:TetR/AcrR family transcriptional regulator [Herbidospora mongoliensis]|uniref:TetR/AcrR family transcriptional regulator n=1 Tax=Herbidospora mongoliensis TaxID=688067 RepID=UPI00082D3C1F|nr:TetR/AcrR family transcriptional regulator [Herbidospora mongoliensis]
MSRKARVDALSNRQAIVAVARDAFARDGLDVPTREIARLTGLGVATIYRHFPTRTDLVSAALAEHVTACRADMRAAQAEADPWTALSTVIRRFAAHQARSVGLVQALFGTPAAGDPFGDDRRAQASALERLVERARSAQALRAGVSLQDVRVALMAIASVRASREVSREAAIEKLLETLLAGLKAGGSGE